MELHTLWDNLGTWKVMHRLTRNNHEGAFLFAIYFAPKEWGCVWHAFQCEAASKSHREESHPVVLTTSVGAILFTNSYFKARNLGR